MSTTVTYKGETLTTVDNQTRTLLTSGKYLEDNITLTDVSGGGGVQTTYVEIYGGTVYWTDSNMTPQQGAEIMDNIPSGTIVAVYYDSLVPPTEYIGLDFINTVSEGKTRIEVYRVR